MKKILLIIFALLLVSPAYSYPLDINTKKEHNLPPEIENFKYWYGDISHGYLIYIGTKDIAGFETELHVHFSKKRITKSLLILGPAGLGEYNCIKKYWGVLKILNEKYGHYKHQKITKDSMLEDLITTSQCAPVRLELYTIETYWKSKDLEIITTLLGDDSGFYIEIEYIVNKKSLPNKLKKIL